MKDDTLFTAGSCRMRSASCCWRSAMAANEMDWSASVVACSVPVSCTGKKPLGTHKYSTTVSTSVAPKASQVRPRRFSTHCSARP
jgi:hypothetical protein